MCREPAAKAGPKEEISKQIMQTFDKKTSASHLYMPHLLPFIDSSGCLESIKTLGGVITLTGPFPCQTAMLFFQPRPQHSNVESQKAHFGNSSSDSSLHLREKTKFQNWPGQLEEVEKREKKTARTFPCTKIIIMEKSWKKILETIPFLAMP